MCFYYFIIFTTTTSTTTAFSFFESIHPLKQKETGAITIIIINNILCVCVCVCVCGELVRLGAFGSNQPLLYYHHDQPLNQPNNKWFKLMYECMHTFKQVLSRQVLCLMFVYI